MEQFEFQNLLFQLDQFLDKLLIYLECPQCGLCGWQLRQLQYSLSLTAEAIKPAGLSSDENHRYRNIQRKLCRLGVVSSINLKGEGSQCSKQQIFSNWTHSSERST